MTSEGSVTYPDPGPPAELVWLDLDLLSVDDSYQRDAAGEKSQRHIRKIAQSFSWAWFQPPTVVRRPDGGYVVVDGQHRVEAARLHPAIDKVPCSVVTLPDQAAEAQTFIAINGARMTVHAKHLLKARLAAGDPSALEVSGVLTRAGVQVAGAGRLGGLKPGWTQAAGKIEMSIRRFGADTVIEALLALKDAAGERANQLGMVPIGAASLLVHELAGNWDRGRFVRAAGGRPVEDWVHEARPFALGMGGIDKAVAAAWKSAYDAAPVSIFPTAQVVEKIDMSSAPADPPRSDSAAAHPNLATTRVVFGDAVARRGSLAVAPETAPAKPKQRDPVERRWLLALRPAIEARKSLAVFDNFEPSDVLLAQRLAKEAAVVG